MSGGGAQAPGDGRAPGRKRREPGDERARAYDASLRLLAARARSRSELADRLHRKGYGESVVAALLDDLERAGLLDDADFASQWVYFRHRDGARSRRALGAELRDKGVDADVIDDALSQITDDDEYARAGALVRRTLARRGQPAADDADAVRRAQRRLLGMLARKGYGAELAHSVVTDEWSAARGDERAGAD